MTTEEANKKADEYVEMFIVETRVIGDDDVEDDKFSATKCAIKLVDELIKENESVFTMLKVYGDLRTRLPIHNRLSDLQQVKEVLINRLK